MQDNKDLNYMPNQRWHQIISFVKSGVRLAGYCLLPFYFEAAVMILVLSEAIGIIEELV
tara:strand:- start:1335 stop:1511 length:177 start_codon:yes stop_codon:yes gene_type:complete